MSVDVSAPVNAAVRTLQPGEVFAIAILAMLALVVAVVLLWVLPITLGIRCARRKHYPPQWMWFAIHPVAGWIAYLVFVSMPPRRVCANCGGYVAAEFRLCPFCHSQMTSV